MPGPVLKNINPMPDERPTEYADRIGQTYLKFIQNDDREPLGQYFTPVSIADFMSSLVSDFDSKELCILDPGAGTGILSCALIEHLSRLTGKLNKVQLVAYECDKQLIPLLKKCLDYAKVWSKENNIEMNYKVLNRDFILENAAVLEKVKSFSERKVRYDYIISNPPYFKLQKSDPRAKISSSVIYGQPNIYALFMAISALLLKARGEMIFITPRSFAAGSYFKLFREKYFTIVRPSHIHLFESREETFDRDSVLQENVIIKAIRDDNWQNHHGDHIVNITSSKGLNDLLECVTREVPLKDVIDMYSKNKFLHIPLSEKADDIIQLVNSWNNNLHDFDMEISTGPVVPFRAKDVITDSGDIEKTHAPLIWMQNVREMSIEWPVIMKKSQFILMNQSSKKILVENRNYVLLRRFSPKEDNKRLKTTPYTAGTIRSQYLGLENHLNYIHRPSGELTKEEIYGISALLNSNIIDCYIRTFNGNTEISATELRSVPLPELELIKKIGKRILKNNLSNGEIDEYVNDQLLSNYIGINKDEKAAIYG